MGRPWYWCIVWSGDGEVVELEVGGEVGSGNNRSVGKDVKGIIIMGAGVSGGWGVDRYVCGEVVSADGITFDLDDESEMGSFEVFFGVSNDGKVEGAFIYESLV